MRTTYGFLAAVCCVALTSAMALGQADRPREGDRPPAERRDRGPGERRDGDRPMGERGDREGPPREGMGPGGMTGPMRDGPMREMEMMRGYLDLVDRYTRLSKDPQAAAIAAVVTATDVLRPRGNEAIIEYLTKLLPEVKDETVQRAVRLQLVDAYKRSQQAEKALEQLQALITASPAKSAAPAAP